MAAWDDAIRAALKLAGKGADEIEKVIANLVKAGAGGVDNVAEDVAKVATKAEPSVAEVAMMSKAERSAYNAAKAIKDREVTGAAAMMKKARAKFENVTETENVINATLGEKSKTKLGTEGIQSQFDKWFRQAEGGSPSTILKRTLNDPDYKALQTAEDKAVAKAEDEVFAAIEKAKNAGKPMTETEIRSLVASKAKQISTEVGDEFKTKATTDIESMKARAAEGKRSLSKRENEAIAAKEKASYTSAKERADQIAEQAKAVAAGGDKAVATRVETLKGLTPEEQRMSGVKSKLLSEKTRAEATGGTAFIDKLKAMAADKKLLPIMKDGKQLTEEIIVDGKKLTVPKYETRAEQSLRLEKAKETTVAEQALKPVLGADGKQVFEKVTIDGTEMDVPKYTNPDGSPYIHKKAPAGVTKYSKDAEAMAQSGKETESSAKLRMAQEANAARNPPRPPLGSTSSKDRPWSYLKTLPDNRAGYTDAEAKDILSKLGKGEDAPRGVIPKSELKGRKWVRDADGKLVLAKK
jgi:hypothetical protein